MNKTSSQPSKIRIVDEAGKSRRPGPGRPTREQAKLRNLELLDRALDLFLKNGFERTTMEGIASDLGMAKRTVYSQYGDKKTLFKASLQRAIDEWIVPVDVLRSAETDNLEETLLEIGRLLVDNILTPAGLRLLRITNAESNTMPEISAYTYAQGTKLTIEYLAELFRRRADLGAADADDAALAFLYLVVGGPANSAAWGVEADIAEIHRHTRFSVRMLLYGMLSDKLRHANGRSD